MAEQMWRLQQMCNVGLSITVATSSRHDEWLPERWMGAASCALSKCDFLSLFCLYSFNPAPPSLLSPSSPPPPVSSRLAPRLVS